jgi:YD repeat-containing protein
MGDMTGTTLYGPGHLFVSQTSATFDGDGRQLSSTDADGNETDYVYDALGDVTGTTLYRPGHVLVSASSASFDGDGRELTSTEADGNG